MSFVSNTNEINHLIYKGKRQMSKISVANTTDLLLLLSNTKPQFKMLLIIWAKVVPFKGS